ncbi:MAG: hypothetical protein R3B13_13115 [Polyangiaceae bacterium]
MQKKPGAGWTREFSESMPRSYRGAFDATTVEAHAQVALARGDHAAFAGLMPADRGAPSSLCVVADDRPGLLATISAALVLCDVDVIDAEAHTRRTSGGRAEAVDLFWVRHASEARRGEPLTAEDVDAINSTLQGLLSGHVDPETARPPEVTERPGPVETTVRFVEGEDGSLSVLEVETDDRGGLLLALARALYQQRVQIEQSSVKTRGDRVLDRFSLVELDGGQISPERRLSIQVAVLGAVDPTRR